MPIRAVAKLHRRHLFFNAWKIVLERNNFLVQGVLDYHDDWVQKKFPDNQNPDNRGTTIQRKEIPIIKELLI